ncbi:nuclear transport factor 2 family protein [Mesoflavibacter profundi]|uniref:nuclear transport factor 2 family protein n=1 Tax=Mesoflavibacter profundi TaxID=2708110 RepID=UPI00351736F5
MTPKEVVKRFYSLDFVKDNNVLEYIHKDCILHWNSSKGYMCSNYKMIEERIATLKKAFHSFTYKLSHLLEDNNNTVTARYTIYVTSIENPQEEEVLAHFITIWEIKDQQLYKGYEISQLGDDTPENLQAFSEINV